MAHRYMYTPISENHIRLISLRPAASHEDQLECELIIENRLTNANRGSREYEALSYVWGQDDGTYTQLKILSPGNRNTPNKYFWVQPNLAAALKRFRLTDKPRVLWTDVICINQVDNDEKSHQLKLMENTYSQATRVLVWLGDPTDTSKMAIEFMHTMTTPGTNCDELAKENARQWEAVEKLMRMSWFTRRWIVQEIALARTATLYCGNEDISWDRFCDAVTLFLDYHADIKPSFLSQEYSYSRNHLGEVKALGAGHLVYITTNLFQKSTEGEIQRRQVTLEALVSALTMFQAGIPHDLIYAVIPIAKDIRTVLQKNGTISPDALALETPPAVEEQHDLGSEEPPRKNPKTRRSEQVKQRFRKAARTVYDHHNDANVVADIDQRPRKGDMGDIVNRRMRGRPTQFIVDYNLSFLRVCMDFIAYAISQSHSLDIICRPWVPEDFKRQFSLPSWLVDSNKCAFLPQNNGIFARVNADPLVGQNAMRPKWYKACGELARPQRVARVRPNDGWGFGRFDRDSDFKDGEDSHRSLFVTGFVLATIGEIQDKASDGVIPTEWFNFAGWHDFSASPPDDLWRTLMANRDSSGEYVGPYYQRTLCDIVQRHCAQGGALNPKNILATPSSDRRSEKLLDRILAVTPNRRLFKTTKVRDTDILGLAPAKAKAGDLVCILFGCSVPVILRSYDTDIDGKPVRYYELLGDAYVHGMMDGAAMEEQDILGTTTQQFEIR